MRQLSFILFLFISTLAFAQGSDEQLANLYFDRGEYAKAVTYFERVVERAPSKINIFRLVTCYEETDQLRDAEKLLKKQIDRYPFEYDFHIELGAFYTDHDEADKADKVYNQLIDDLPASANSVIRAYNAFRSKNLNEYAKETLDRGQKLLKNTYPLDLQYADFYGATGQTEKMFNAYLDLLDRYPNYTNYVQNILSRQIDFQEESATKDQLKSALLERVQRNPNNPTYGNMLTWFFIQSKQFSAALTQVIASDKRENGQGYRVMDIGLICLENRDYETARKAFRYVVNLGGDTPLYYKAELAMLNSRYSEITESNLQDSSIIAAAIQEYKQALSRLGVKRNTIELVKELAHLEAYYGRQIPAATQRLQNALELGGLTDVQRAEVKMKLADIQVLSGEMWEASLYYMQIDKDFKYEPIGQEAKYKNARIFYYDGEFEFAQAQLNVLKQATTKLIANDAMQLSILITENYGMDSNYIAMNWFAKGEMMIVQHRYEEAYAYFDSIQTEYSYHGLTDDILMVKAEAEMQRGNYTDAVAFLEELLKFYAFDRLADKALFLLGDIHQFQYNELEKAKDYYKRILFDYKGSLYVGEARKRFRDLRGDGQEKEES